MNTHTDPRIAERERAARRIARARSTAPRLAYSIDETAVALGVSRRTIYDLISDGRLTSAKIGARRVISHSELERFLAELASEAA